MRPVSYEVNLPVFKSGDDMWAAMEASDGDSSKAFQRAAETYSAAAEICKKLSVLASQGSLRILRAQGRCILVRGEPEVLDTLEKEGLLYCWREEGNEEEDETLLRVEGATET